MYVFYHTFGARCCLFFFLFLGISPPIFEVRSLRSRFFLGVWSKSRVSFWTEKNTRSCHRIDSIHFRGATLYLLFSPLFLHQSTHSLLLFSFPKHQNSHKKGASQSPASTPKIKCIFFAFFSKIASINFFIMILRFLSSGLLCGGRKQCGHCD